MKTALSSANKKVLALVLPCCLVLGLTALAQDAQAQASPPGAVIPAPVLAPASTVADTTPKIVPPPSDTPDAALATAVTPPADKDEKGGKSLGNAEDKVTDAVKGVAKRLSSTDNVTLDDLNSAKQAVTKIEALIDLEKHLNELDKLRSEREGAGRNSLPGAIPASALSPLPQAPMPTIPSMPMPAAMPAPAMVMQELTPSFNAIEVTRITGSDGRFSAIVKTPDGQTKTVEVGDKLEGASVTTITSAGVTLDYKNTKHLVPVKNIQTVFGNTP